MVGFNDNMKDFADFINNNDLMDMEMCGVKLTWSKNMKGVDLIQVNLDRLLALSSWEGLTSSSLIGLPRTISNHTSSLIRLPRTILNHTPILFNWKEDS